ncbi:hypothetical protein BDF19DRAFT_418979 [Syncephalis fuscata]|nr:hypothetical protein BDF19DRAFT_418979 [Syncephalis fuscata]
MNSELLNGTNEEAVNENKNSLVGPTTNNKKQDSNYCYVAKKIIQLYEENGQLRDELSKTKSAGSELFNKELQSKAEVLKAKIKELKKQLKKEQKMQVKIQDNCQKKEEQLEHEYCMKQIELERKLKHEYNERRKELESSYWRKEDKQIEKYCEKEIELENSYKEKEEQLGKRKIELQQGKKHAIGDSSLYTCYCRAAASTSKEIDSCCQENNNDYKDMAMILASCIKQYKMTTEAVVRSCDNILNEPSDKNQIDYEDLYNGVKISCHNIMSRLNTTQDKIRKDILLNQSIIDLDIISEIEFKIN